MHRVTRSLLKLQLLHYCRRAADHEPHGMLVYLSSLADAHLTQSTEDYILACVDLYLDIINLFLFILRILSDRR